jgi:hypothetical protein
MFKIEELSGHLIRSGRFRDAIWPFSNEVQAALHHGVITLEELFALQRAFSFILLNPSNPDEVVQLSNRMLKLALRIPGYVPSVGSEEFEKNLKASRGETD